jgi:hypothetical protein
VCDGVCGSQDAADVIDAHPPGKAVAFPDVGLLSGPNDTLTFLRQLEPAQSAAVDDEVTAAVANG